MFLCALAILLVFTAVMRSVFCVLGSLAPMRAFGNARFKWPADIIKEVAVLSQDGDEEIGVGGDYRIPDQANWILPYYKYVTLDCFFNEIFVVILLVL